MQNKTLLAVVGEIFGEDAQHKGPTLPQLEKKPSESAQLSCSSSFPNELPERRQFFLKVLI